MDESILPTPRFLAADHPVGHGSVWSALVRDDGCGMRTVLHHTAIRRPGRRFPNGSDGASRDLAEMEERARILNLLIEIAAAVDGDHPPTPPPPGGIRRRVLCGVPVVHEHRGTIGFRCPVSLYSDVLMTCGTMVGLHSTWLATPGLAALAGIDADRRLDVRGPSLEDMFHAVADGLIRRGVADD